MITGKRPEPRNPAAAAAAAEAQPIRRRITCNITQPKAAAAAAAEVHPEQPSKRARDTRGRFVPTNPPPATVDENGAITSAPDQAAEKAIKRKEARERAKAATQANPKAKARANAKPKSVQL